MKYLKIENLLNEISGHGSSKGPFYQTAGRIQSIFHQKDPAEEFGKFLEEAWKTYKDKK